MHAPSRLAFERYVAIGDSSTEGIDDPDGQGGYRGWSQRLAERIALIQGRLLYANLGVRGRTTRQIRDQQLAPALAMQPDLATVFSGTNDVLARRFDADAVGRDMEVLQRALIEGGATVLSFTLPDLTPVMPIARWIAPRVAPSTNRSARPPRPPERSCSTSPPTRSARTCDSGARIASTRMRPDMPGSPMRSPTPSDCRAPTTRGSSRCRSHRRGPAGNGSPPRWPGRRDFFCPGPGGHCAPGWKNRAGRGSRIFDRCNRPAAHGLAAARSDANVRAHS